MSKIAIKSAEAGTATFTIEAPATNTDRIFELPDEAGKVLTDASDIEPQVKTATNASGNAPIYACRAWVNFDGSASTPAIRASGNVSSVTRNGTGDYTVNFATAMPDANYSANAMGTIGSGTVRPCYPNEFTGSASQLASPTPRSVSSFRFFLTTSDAEKVNSSSLSLQFFR